jgi:Zn finger protein HypA/HybF involved in hydrogenase expression
MSESNELLVHCGRCSHEWVALRNPILLHEAAELVYKLCCPQCDETSGNIFAGAALNTSVERVNETEKS